MKNTYSWLAILSVLAFSASAWAGPKTQKCTYSIDPHTVHVNWTAFKTTQKVRVGGSFTEVTVTGDLTNSKSMAALLNQLDAEIDLTAADKINTGNAARDKTLFEKFFSLIKAKPVMKGKLRHTKGTDDKGDVSLVLTMNRKTLSVPMSYTRDAKGLLTIKGAIDVNDFGLSGALANLSKACFDLHKGPDGVSKTWPEVEIELQANVAKACR